jgi:hypothetical protein
MRIQLRTREMCHGFGPRDAGSGFPIHEYKGLSLLHATKQQDGMELFQYFAETAIAAMCLLEHNLNMPAATTGHFSNFPRI